MHIERLSVKNFRNLEDVEIFLRPGTVVVGANRAGKSNLVHALRLVLDGSLSHADRQLGREDFWAAPGTDRDPMALGEVVEASIDIVDFEHEPQLLAALGDALLGEVPLRARLTYRFAPIDDGVATAVPRYRGAVYGGDQRERPLPSDVRSTIYLLFLHALRDVEADIRNWRRSPLRALLQAAASAAEEEDLDDVRKSMRDANARLNELEVIRDLSRNIGGRLTDMVGDAQAIETELAAAPEDPLKLIRNMRLFVDGDAHRTLTSASLGTLNVLYLALQELGLDSRTYGESDIAHVVTAIEEPEAHLHPHLQRLIFRRLLATRARPSTVLVTTQSPYIASVADPRSLVVLRDVDGRTVAASAHRADLDEAGWDDIARYLDATKAELVFARRVLLVEGFAEQVLMPVLARAIGIDLDKEGITVCAIHGTHFTPFVRFCDALELPWAIVTDGDVDKAAPYRGISRVGRIVAATRPEHRAGFFIGDHTFEHDLIAMVPENVEPSLSALASLCAEPSAAVVASWNGLDPGPESFLGMIDSAGGKGRYAQRLALYGVQPPPYIERALRHLVAR
ncbi:ATP-dependent nuclease [Amycolatopsis sp. cmx-4-83]|uniref:ATP-dependent nuclease n=1 Tax=Amycolatopsis sp. cmx-4-83 TaxID=2790940 RepID=UPI00397BFF2F